MSWKSYARPGLGGAGDTAGPGRSGRDRKPARTGLAVAAAGVLGAAMVSLAPGAQAATGTLVDRNLDVYSVLAADGRANEITISDTVTPAGVRLLIVADQGDIVIPGNDCTAVSDQEVQCVLSSAPRLAVSTGDLDDTVTNLTPIPAVIHGGPGGDAITAGNAVGGTSNIVTGDAGVDTLNGGSGLDRLLGGAGTDRLFGNGSNDTLDGGPGADVMNGGDGGDTFQSSDTVNDGADTIDGAGGGGLVTYASRTVPVSITFDGVANDGAAGENDTLLRINQVFGGAAGDTMTGDSTFQQLSGGPGNDTLDGGGAGDTLDGGAGNDTLLGGPGQVAGVADDDLLSGGDGIDTATYAGRTTPVTVTLNSIFAAPNDGHAGENDEVVDTIENVIGGTSNDSLTGSAVANRLSGGNGTDTLAGGQGADVLLGENGDDTLNSVDNIGGNDQLNGGLNTDTCTADAGDAVANCE